MVSIGFFYFHLHDSGSSAADGGNVFSGCKAKGSGDTWVVGSIQLAHLNVMPVSELGERTAIILGVHRGGKGECSETLPILAVSFPLHGARASRRLLP